MAKRFADGCWQVVSLGNVFIVEHDGLVLVDTGVSEKVDKVLAGIEAAGHLPTDVRAIYVTHYHSDHVGGLAQLANITQARVFAPGGEAGIIRSGSATPPKEKRGWKGEIFIRLQSTAAQQPAPVHEEVKGGDTLPDGTKVIATPGHTGDHVAYILPVHGGLLCTGDAAINAFFKPEITPINEDFTGAEQSFVSLSNMGGYEMIGFGHGRPITSDARSKMAAAARRYKR
jgi:glyoxylase-like metal-dependent hydrolase (beta-lactamase superfamily II)